MTLCCHSQQVEDQISSDQSVGDVRNHLNWDIYSNFTLGHAQNVVTGWVLTGVSYPELSFVIMLSDLFCHGYSIKHVFGGRDHGLAENKNIMYTM